MPRSPSLKKILGMSRREYLEHQIRQTGGSMSKIAARVGMERTHLYRKMRALGIDPKRVVAGSE